MKVGAPDCWTNTTSVFLTSYWGWTPETWGTVGWSHDRGRARRDNLLKELSNPFITVVYVTKNKSDVDPNLKQKIAGFYLVSHETGHRDDFTHPIHHVRDRDRWRHSLRAIRAFTYLPEYRSNVLDVFPEIKPRVLAVAAMGEQITNAVQVDILRTTPWTEVEVYSPRFVDRAAEEHLENTQGMVPPGPDNAGGYNVPERELGLPRELYVLRLKGDTRSFLGSDEQLGSIYKIGFSHSPELRRQSLQKSMPRGAYSWETFRSTRLDGHSLYSGYAAAVAGETAMKKYLVANGHWLGGEFYLATDEHIASAWQIARKTAMELVEGK